MRSYKSSDCSPHPQASEYCSIEYKTLRVVPFHGQENQLESNELVRELKKEREEVRKSDCTVRGFLFPILMRGSSQSQVTKLRRDAFSCGLGPLVQTSILSPTPSPPSVSISLLVLISPQSFEPEARES